MNNIEILYYLRGDDDSIFIELKRLDYKGCKDKSKYVSWFRIMNNNVKNLNFIRMDGGCRYFEEGELIMIDNIFIENNNNIILNKSNIDINNVKLCIDYWNKE